MELNEILKNIWHIHFESQFKLTSTFLRFQEHYESPEFRGKIFSLSEYKDWYTKNSVNGKKTGKFTYYKDWKGFNIPSFILEPFYEGKFNPLSKKEKNLLGLFEGKRDEKFYLIGTYGKRIPLDVLNHEIAHGLFYTTPRYRTEVLQAMEDLSDNARKKISKFLTKKGYHPDLMEDETHAYVFYDLEKMQKLGIKDKSLIEVHHNLTDIFNKFTK